MLRALLLLALAPEPACGARDGDGAGAHAAYCRPDRRPTGQGAAEQASRDAESGIPVTGVAKSRFHTATPRGAGRARILGTPVVRHRRRDARSLRGGLVWHMDGRYRPPDALRRADTSRGQIRPPP